MKLNNSSMQLVILCDGEHYPIEAVCSTEAEANTVCQSNPDFAVMAKDYNGHIYVTKKNPSGPKVRGGYTQTELSRAFDKVKNQENWKMPIDALVDLTEDLKCIDEAIRHFTGSRADFVAVNRDGKEQVRVRAEGYYNAVGS